MINRFLLVLLSFFPALVFADSSSTTTLTFSPPSTDYSMVFLGNLFGVVDGVLHGTGSQMMGAIFVVFNSAVLALGGIIIMYTLIVSTLNTAHEGQMLGQKWSSIWIPLRSTLGLALLIPKASGYCLMQIFVMWVITQGVGAADTVWAAALGYLNRGGVIVQSEGNPVQQALAPIDPSAYAVPSGAMTILTGQVCMLGLQKQLEAQRTLYTQQPSGVCNGSNVDPALSGICSTPVPDFMSSINFVSVQQNNGAGPYSVRMPNISSDNPNSPYAALDGLCGTVSWNQFTLPSSSGSTTLTSSESQTTELSRAIAIQQMYSDLSTVALQMVANSPQLSPSTNSNSSSSSTNYSLVAARQFGVPYTSASVTCTNYNQSCNAWGSDSSGSGTSTSVFLNGTEFNGAVQDYNAIMMPSLNLQNQMNAANNGDNSKAFIDKANTQGWIMAGAYFYDLVKLNGSATANSGATDTNSGLQNSSAVNFTSISSNSTLQGWLGSNSAQLLMQVESLIDGTQLTNSSPGVPATGQSEKPPSVAPDANRVATTGLYSSTVYGYVNNGLMMQIPGQPGVQPLKFANLINFNMSSTPNYFQHQNFSCGNVTTFVFKFCLGRLLGDIFFNVIFLNIFNVFMYIFATFLQQILMAFIMVPIQAFSTIFINGVQTIDTPGANPVVALANMGINYINFAGNLWVTLMGMAAASILFGPFFAFILVLGTPLVFSWLGIMVGIGFTTAYYIPILPYMIFTFGALAWLIAVIEAMVAAPIVALGVTHPEGHDAFGKGEAGVMLLMNVFLRPSLMIIGYISGIALSYVGVWMLNAGYDTAISFMQDPSTIDQGQSGYASVVGTSHYGTLGAASSTSSSTIANYSDWAGVFAWFFSILIYTTMYLTIVQKSFTLISYLPDKVLRWIGGSPESLGTEAAQWGDESVKGKISAGAEKSQDAQQQIAKQAEAKAKEKMGEAKAMGSKATSSGNMSSSPGGGGAGGGDAGGEADGQ